MSSSPITPPILHSTLDGDSTASPMTMLGTPVSSFHEGELAGGHAQSTPGPSRPRHSLDYRPDETRRPMKSTYQILRDAGVDLELLPLVFLESYPHPALVLVSSVPSPDNPDRYSSPFSPHTPYTVHHQSGSEPPFPLDLPWTPVSLFQAVHPLKPVWTNSSWKALAAGVRAAEDKTGGPSTRNGDSGSLFEFLSLDSLRRFGHWLSGCDDPSVSRGVRELIPDLKPFRALDTLTGPHLEDCEPRPPRTTGLVSTSSIILEFDFPGVGGITRMELTKTSMPISQVVDGTRLSITTHTFVVLTTTPRAPEERVGQLPPSLTREKSPRSPRRDILGSPTLFPTANKSMNVPPPAPLTPPQPEKHESFPSLETFFQKTQWSPDRPIFIHSDGSVSRQNPPTGLWTADGMLPYATDKLLEMTDWSKTPLGPREQWSPTLEVMVQLLRMYPLCGGIWWGKELTLIYNQMYGDNLPHHPHAYGLSGREAWAELWSTLGPMTEVIIGGTPVFVEDTLILLKDDDNATYETYQSQMWFSLNEPDGSFGGIFHGMRYTTQRVLGERRAALINDIGVRTAPLRTLNDFYHAVVESLETDPRDVPFAILYTVNESSQVPPRRTKARSKSCPSSRAVRLTRVGTVGVPHDHPSAPSTINVAIPNTSSVEALMGDDLPTASLNLLSLSSSGTSMRQSLSSQGGSGTHTESCTVSNSSACGSPISTRGTPLPVLPSVSHEEIPWSIREAIVTREPVIVADCSSLIQDYPVRVWNELPTSAVVIPIFHNHEQKIPSLLLILGLSCRLAFDNDYELFIQTLRNCIAENFLAVRSYEADALRMEDADALDNAKNILFTNVSHQLFMPLNLVAGPLDDVLVDMPAGQQRDALVLARRNVRRLTRLVNILMDVSRLEANSLKTSFRCVNLGKITRDLAGLFRSTANAANVDLILDCDVTPHDVYVDREMWEKMLFNLVGNACEYTKEGSIIVSVKYTTTEAVFFVKDTGVGIPAVELEHMFSEGTGMALSFTNKLAEIHHGTLEVESRTAEESEDGSHGTTCTVRLPLGTEHLSPDVIDQSNADGDTGGMAPEDIRRWHLAWAGTNGKDASYSPLTNSAGHSRATATVTGGSPAGSDLSGRFETPLSVGSGGDYLSRGGGHLQAQPVGVARRLRGIDPSTLFFVSDDVVMLVDNNLETLRYMRSIFEPFCKVVEARDGHEALAKFPHAKPDIIIADAKLPRMDAFELLHILRQGTKEQEMVPFIILQSLQQTQGANSLAADDYISKPFNARELISRAHIQLQIGKRRKLLEEMFDKRTAELRSLCDRSPIGIFRATSDGYLAYANDAWHDLTSYPKDVKPITDWGVYLAEEEQPRVRAAYEAFIIGRGSRQLHDIALWKNGKYISVTIVRLNPVEDGTEGFVGYLVDVTERKLNEELQRQRVMDAEKRQAEAEAAKQQQELLIDITSYCASLVKNNLGVLHEQFKHSLDKGINFMPTDQQLLTIDEDLEALDSIYQCGLTQERISNDVLSLGKIQLDMLQMFDVETDVYQEAQKLVSVFQNEARMKGISLSFQVSDAFRELGIRGIMTDPLRLGQVITNLLANAIRFTGSSTIRNVELHLDVGAEPPSDLSCEKPCITSEVIKLTAETPIYVFVAVKDTGPGLTPDELELLFRRFSQASPKTHTVFGGSGLGLFVCRKITELMGGRIEVVSEVGKGSMFRFFVSARPVLAENSASVTAHQHRANGAARTRIDNAPGTRMWRNLINQVAAGPRRRVLIVEDNIINQKALARQLKHIGFDVDVASDGLEGVYKVHAVMGTTTPGPVTQTTAKPPIPTPPPSATERPFDCVLMDLEMPVMDGYTATRRLRADEKERTIAPVTIIALTGNARHALIDEAMVDFDDVVVKPYRLDQLLRQIEDSIRKRGARDPPVVPAAQ